MCGSPVSCGNSSSPLTELFPLPGEYSLSLKATTSFLKTNTRETDRAKSRQVGTAWYLIQVNYRENKKIEKTVKAKISFCPAVWQSSLLSDSQKTPKGKAV